MRAKQLKCALGFHHFIFHECERTSKVSTVHISGPLCSFHTGCFNVNRVSAVHINFETKQDRSYHDLTYQPGDWLVFGKETVGFDRWILEKFSKQVVSIPVMGKIRSLNLATAVAVAIYEGLRQIDAS